MGRWRDNYDDWGYYDPARPIRVQGGIKTKKEYGQIGETWWSKRWIAVLESFSMGMRLTRDRSYARQGQVILELSQKKEVQPQLMVDNSVCPVKHLT